MMTMTTIKRTGVLIILLLGTLTVSAQEKDFGIWYSADAELKIIKGLQLDISPNVRTFANASKIEEVFLDAGLTYKLIKHLSLGAGYRITENLEDDDKYHPQHKLFFDIKSSFSPGDFTLSGRIRYQWRYKTYIEDAEDDIPDTHLRVKLKVQYDIPSFKFNPFISSELFFPLNKDIGRTLEKERFMLGFDYSFSRKHSIEAGYIFQKDFHPDLVNMNIISLGYNLNF